MEDIHFVLTNNEQIRKTLKQGNCSIVVYFYFPFLFFLSVIVLKIKFKFSSKILIFVPFQNFSSCGYTTETPLEPCQTSVKKC